MSRSNVWPWVRPFLIIVLAISIPPLVYWFGYVQSSVTSAKQQAYATLAAVSAELSTRVAAHDQIAENAERYSSVPWIFNYLKSILSLQAMPGLTPRDGPVSHLEVSRQVDGLVLNISITSAGDSRCKSASGCIMEVLVPMDKLLPGGAGEEKFDGLLILDEHKKLLMQHGSLPPQPLGIVMPLHFRDAPFDTTELLGDSPKEPAATAAKEKPKAAESSATRSVFDFADDVTLQVGGVEYIAFIQSVSVPRTANAAAATPPGATQAGAESQPAKIRRPDPLRLLVCGLISKARLRHEAIQLAPQTLITVATLGLMGLFAIPFLKLRFIGQQERMRQRDVWLLAVSILFATATMVLVLQDLRAMAELRRRFDAGALRFAQSVAEHLRSESAAAADQLYAVGPALTGGPLLDGEIPQATATPCYARPEGPAGSADRALSPLGAILTRQQLPVYPDIEAVLITDLCGNQIRKWMARTVPTPSINIAKESYFRPALALSHDPTVRDSRQFAFGSTLAPTSGLLLGIYAIPVDEAAHEFGTQIEQAHRTGIMSLATQMQAVAAPVIAQPYQFVLIDRRGAVAFQGMRGAFLGERFYETVVGGESLELAARARSVGSAAGSSAASTPETYQYRGKAYRMTALDIPELELTLVSSYEAQVIGNLAARALTTSAAFTCAIISALLLVAAILPALKRDTPYDWMWPAASRTGYYALGISICLLVAASLLWVCTSHAGQLLGWVILATPAFTLLLLSSCTLTRRTAQRKPAAAASALTRNTSDKGTFTSPLNSALAELQTASFRLPVWVKHWAERHSLVPALPTQGSGPTPGSDVSPGTRGKPRRLRWERPRSLKLLSGVYTTLGVTVLMVFIALPTALVFEDALNLHGAEFAESVWKSWTVAKLKRDETTAAAVIDTGRKAADGLVCKDAHDVRCTTPERLYASSDNHHQLVQQRSAYGLYHDCATLTDAAADCDARNPPAAPASFTAIVARWLAFFSGASAQENAILSDLAPGQSDAPGLAAPPYLQWSRWDVVGSLLLIAILALLVHSVAKHVLGVNLTSGVVLDEHELTATEGSTRWLLLRPTRQSLEKSLNTISGRLVRFDLRHEPCSPAFPPDAADCTVLVEHLEAHLADSKWRNALLVSLEAMGAGRILLTSEVDPLHYLTQTLREKCNYLGSIPASSPEKRAKTEQVCSDLRHELARWVLVLRAFRKIRETTACFSDPPPTPDLPPALRAQVMQECSGSEELIAIGRRLLQREDLHRYRWDDIVGFVLDAAEPYYHSIWELCSREERLVLIQLAQVGLVNPKRAEIVRRLARRGLVIVEPRFRLMNRSFQRFVCAAEPPVRVLEWERSGTALPWSHLGTPLYALGAMVIAVLLFAEQGMLTNILAVATGSAATLGSLRSLYATMTKLPETNKMS